MKRRTSVTLSVDLLKASAREARTSESRADVIERLLRECLTARAHRERANIAAHADKLRAEAAALVADQADLRNESISISYQRALRTTPRAPRPRRSKS